MSRRATIWALGALLGIVLTAAITWATSLLTSQHIGLSSEPISAGASLAPATAPRITTTQRTTTTVTRKLTSSARSASGPVSVTTTMTFTHTEASSHSHGERDDGGRGSGGGSQAGRRSEGRHPDD